VTVTNSTLAANSATYGAGIDNGSTVTLISSTLTGNMAQGAGGGINNGGTVTVTNCTLAGNSVTGMTGAGGGIDNNASDTVSLVNTIIATNTATTGPDDDGTFTSNGHNLIGETGGSNTVWLSSDLTGASPLLAPLGDYGGPTQTMALRVGSPALRAGAAITTITGLTITDGQAADGGGIYNAGVQTVNSSALSGNSAQELGGGIDNTGTLTVTNSSLSGNRARGDKLDHGGGIDNDGGAATITSSTLSGNSVTNPGAEGGGIDISSGTPTIASVTLSNNSASFGGGLYNGASLMTVTDSTFAGNTACGRRSTWPMR
jgi:hypothetical protein